MPAFAYDGNMKIVYVPGSNGIADKSGPTTGELTAETVKDLSCALQKGGWTGSPTFNNVEAARACETFDAQAQGTWSASPTGTFFRDNVPGNDVAWGLFEHGVDGYIVIRYGKAYDLPFVNGDSVEVWPVQSSEPAMNENAANTSATFQVGFAVTSQPDLKATVGGGS